MKKIDQENGEDDSTVESDLLTTREAARLLRVSESWLKNRRWKKQEPLPLKMGGKVFYLRQKLQLFMQPQG